MAARGVTVLDDGTIADRRGSLNVDDEGNASQRNVLIEDGILRYIQDSMNARLMKGAHRQRPARKLCPYPHAAHDQHLHAAATRRRKEIVASIKKAVRHQLRWRPGGHHQWQVRVQPSEAFNRKRQDPVPVKGATIVGNGPESLTGDL